MVGMRGAAHVSALKCELAAESCDKFRAQAAKAPLFNQKSKTALRARLPWAMVAVNFDEFHHHRGGLEDLHKYIQGRSDGESSRAHLATHQHIEADPAGLLRGNERDILRLAVRAVVRATRHGDVEFARQVGELRVALAADDDGIQFVDDGRSVK